MIPQKARELSRMSFLGFVKKCKELFKERDKE